MTGYQEIVTDPSYAEQLVCFTAPMVGNYGTAPARSESKRPHARAALMREARGPGVDGLAARARHRRALGDRHAQPRPPPARGRCDARCRGRVRRRLGRRDTRRRARAAVDGRPRARRRRLDATTSYTYSETGDVSVAVVDYGVKRSILARLAAAGAAVTVYPHDVDADELARHDGVLLANGPGDPEPLVDEVAVVRELLGRVPVLGICLGHQLLALAAGMKTYKLPFGHRGANHPVLERATGRVLVTTQNHGFAVEASEEREATHVSLYDGTVEGLDFPAGARALGAVPSRGRARPARRAGRSSASSSRSCVPRRNDLHSICLIGSGPIVIGQACEFDYAGSQALKVLREDGFRTIVVNSNPATIMTDPGFADRTYLEPLDVEGVSQRARARAARRAAADDGRPDGAQPRDRSSRRRACSPSSASS